MNTKKAIKWIIGILISPIILFLILTVLLYLPPIQRWAVGVATDYASEATGMQISIDEVRLKFPLDLKLGGVKALKPVEPGAEKKDTVINAQSIVCDVQLMPLFKSQVKLNALSLDEVRLNTIDIVEAARVKGRVGHAMVTSDCIDLKVDSLILNNVALAHADLDVAMADSVPEDTTESKNDWRIRLQNLCIDDTKVKLHMPGDTLAIGVAMNHAVAERGYFDLENSIFRIAKFDLTDGGMSMDNNFEPTVNGLDFNHLLLSNINIGIDDLYYSPEKTSVYVRACNMKEKSGLTLSSLSTHFLMDEHAVHLPDFAMTTPNSDMKASADVEFSCMDAINPGQIRCNMDGRFGKQDIMLFLADMPQAFKRGWPSAPLTVKGMLQGNMKQAVLKGVNISLPTAFRLSMNGKFANLDNIDHLGADIQLDAATHNINFLTSLADPAMMKMVNIPSGITAKGNVKVANGSHYAVNMLVTEGKGSVKADAVFDANAMAYSAKINARGLNIGHFVKGYGLGVFSGDITAKGHGTDVFSPTTLVVADAKLDRMQYDKYDLRNVSATANITNGRCHIDLQSDNELLIGNISLDALLNTNDIRATLAADVAKADFNAIGLTENPLTAGVCCHVDFESDLDDYYKVQGLISDLVIRDSATVYHPDDMVLDVLTNKETTHAVVDCGDFHLNADAEGGYKHLMGVTERIMDEIDKQLTARTIDEAALRNTLPTGHFFLSTGKENPIARTAVNMGYAFHEANIDMTSSPADGLNGEMAIDTLVLDGSMQLDKIRLNFKSDETQMHYTALVQNGKNNPQATFIANLSGHLTPTGTSADLELLDAENKTGVALGMTADVEDNGIKVAINPEKPIILGYKDFTVNKDNYIFLADDMRIAAKVDMRAKGGMGLQIYTDDENLEALQDVTVSLNHFELAELMSVLPFMPKVSGVMDGDFHVIITPDNMSVSSNVEFANLTYEDCLMGNLSSEFVYVPMADGSHHIDAVLYKDDDEIGTVIGTFNPEEEGSLDATLTMNNLPLNLVNGFIPDQIMGLDGAGYGHLTLRGPLDNLVINGEIRPDKAYIVSVPYGVKMRFADDPIHIVNSRLLFEDFKIYADNNQPLTCNGDFDFSDLEHMKTNISMVAKNFMIIDAKENRRSEAYGRGYVNFYGSVTGELSQLKVRGKLEVLAKSNIFYILRDSPITTDNRLKELVTFTDLSAEMPQEIQRPTVDGINIDLTISVAAGTHIKCWMNTDHSNYLDLVGYGDLRMLYSDDISLTGRYTITEGEMKYSLPVIPLKTFNIAEGSYLEFTGDVMNPRLNITATETTKSNVSINDVNRMVEFNCGVVITKTLNDMGLEFIIDAPEEQTIHDELQHMSVEERGKLAVTMLTTNMYLTDGNTSSFTMNSALSSFLQQEINNIAGSALRTLDLSVGLENSTDEFGTLHTDYSFKFAKRFWNNRLSISVGGKISTGPDVSGQNKSFFDNVEVQYRLGDDSNQYLQLFYDRAVYDYLEGYTGRYGAGYMWKRKLRKFKDIFNFNAPDDTAPVVRTKPANNVIPADTTTKDSTHAHE